MSIKLAGNNLPKIVKANLYKSLQNYTSFDIALLEENIRAGAKGYTKALERFTNHENRWFGALDIFCDKGYKNFTDDFVYVKKFIKDWTELKDGDEHSARCQFGRIFYQVLAKDPNIILEYRKLPGRNFEYRKVC